MEHEAAMMTGAVLSIMTIRGLLHSHTHRSKCRQTIIQVNHLEQNQQKLNATINNRLQLTKYDLLYVQKLICGRLKKLIKKI